MAGLIIGYIMTVLSVAAIAIYLMMLPQIIQMAKTQQALLNQTNNADQTTVTPDQSTPAPAPTNAPDQSTNSAPTTPDESTNSATPSTNAPPVNQ